MEGLIWIILLQVKYQKNGTFQAVWWLIIVKPEESKAPLKREKSDSFRPAAKSQRTSAVQTRRQKKETIYRDIPIISMKMPQTIPTIPVMFIIILVSQEKPCAIMRKSV